MFNVCEGCGAHRSDKIVEASGPDAICPACGFKHRFLLLPLFLVCGPSAAGKTTLCNRLYGQLDRVVALDGDILWRPEFDQPETNYRDFYETWLRICKNINQSGRPAVLMNAGAHPGNVEACTERRYFRETHYLALTCDEAVLRTRLQSRPEWRDSHGAEFIESQVGYARALSKMSLENPAQITLLDTGTDDIDHSVRRVARWIEERLS